MEATAKIALPDLLFHLFEVRERAVFRMPSGGPVSDPSESIANMAFTSLPQSIAILPASW